MIIPCEEGDSSEEKEGILDVKLHLNGNRKINIEMRNRYQEDWSERSIFYNCRMFSEGFIHGSSYASLEPCVHIGILDFILLSSPGYHHRILLMDEKTQEIYSSKFLFHVIELKKLGEASQEERCQELYHWARIIAAKNWEAVCMEAKGNPYREAAKEEMEKLNQSEHERYLYLRREMAISDEISRIQSAKNLGRTEGRKEGRKEGCAEGRADGELLVLIKQIKKKCLKGKTINQIVDELEETMEHITPVFNVINENPEESDEVLLELVKKLHN